MAGLGPLVVVLDLVIVTETREEPAPGLVSVLVLPAAAITALVAVVAAQVVVGRPAGILAVAGIRGLAGMPAIGWRAGEPLASAPRRVIRSALIRSALIRPGTVIRGLVMHRLVSGWRWPEAILRRLAVLTGEAGSSDPLLRALG
jgi:hypothetical protein